MTTTTSAVPMPKSQSIRAVLMTRDEIAFALTAINTTVMLSDARAGAIAALEYVLARADAVTGVKE